MNGTQQLNPDTLSATWLSAEEHVIGAMLVDGKETIDRAITAGLTMETFSDPASAITFQALVDLRAESHGTPVDLSLLMNKLGERAQLETVGGLPWLMQITSKVPTTLYAGLYIDKVKGYAARRTLGRESRVLLERLNDGAEIGELQHHLSEMMKMLPIVAPTGDKPGMSEAEQLQFDRMAGEVEKARQAAKGEFPVHLFPPLMRRVSEQKAALDQVPVCMPALSTAAILSAAVGNSVVVERAHRDKDTYLNLYVFLAAQRGSGKDVTGEELCRALLKISQEKQEEHARLVQQHAAEHGILKNKIVDLRKTLARESSGADADNNRATLETCQLRFDELELERKRRVRLIIDNTTSEALALALDHNDEQLFCYSADAGTAVQVAMGKYTNGQGDCGLHLCAYSGTTYGEDRMGRDGTKLKNPRLTLLWLFQPSIALALLGNVDAFERGLTCRPIFVDTKARREYEDEDDEQELSFTLAGEWGGFIRKIYADRLSAKEPRRITCTKAARKAFKRIGNIAAHLERDKFPALAGELSRWKENAIKLAGVFAVTEGAAEITEELANRAVEVMLWCGFNFIDLWLAAQQEKTGVDLDVVVDAINSSDGEIHAGKLERITKLTRAELDTLAQLYPERLVKEKRKTGGRPALIFKVKS